MKQAPFSKSYRLKSKKAIDILFDRNIARLNKVKIHSFLAYPLRVIWAEATTRTDSYKGSRLLISIPKKKIRHAVDRVKMRRRIREAWRLQLPQLHAENIDVAIRYVAEHCEDYERINAAITKIISKLRAD